MQEKELNFKAFCDDWWRLVNSMALLGYGYVGGYFRNCRKEPTRQYTQFRKLKEGIDPKDLFDEFGLAGDSNPEQFVSMNDKDDLRFYTFAECEKFIREECEKTEKNLKFINEYGMVIEVI